MEFPENISLNRGNAIPVKILRKRERDGGRQGGAQPKRSELFEKRANIQFVRVFVNEHWRT